jgi:hypothetical protein
MESIIDQNTSNAIMSRKKKPYNLTIIQEPFQCESESEFERAMKPYITSEFIPNRMIPIIINFYLKDSQIIHSFSNTHILIKVPINNLLQAPIVNWEYNRPPDMVRCEDIARYIYNSKTQIDTMFYASYNNLKKSFEILDGIHRISSIKIIANENKKPLELVCPTDFGSNNDAEWLYNQYIIMNIRFNSSTGELIETFKTLNKSQTVPDLYIRDVVKEKITIIENITNEWQVAYKKHFSSSANPIIGNTNRNLFVSLLDKLYDIYNINESNVYILRGKLQQVNDIIASNIPSNITLNIRVKCRETGCYLFIYKNDKLLDKYFC